MARLRPIAVAGVFAALVIVLACPARAEPQSRARSRSPAFPPCVAAAPSASGVNAPSYYTDPARSEIDELQKLSYDQAMAPFVDFRRRTISLADAGVLGDAASTRCAGEALAAFARNSGLGNIITPEASRRRAMLLASLAVAWYKIHDHAVVKSSASEINGFFIAEADAAESYFGGLGDRPTTRGNLRAFSALLSAVANATAGRSQDTTRDALTRVLCSVGPDGAMATEAARGSKSADYHLFAARAIAASVAILGARDLPCADATRRLGLKVARDTGLGRAEACAAVRILAPMAIDEKCRAARVTDVMVGGRLDLIRPQR